MKKVLFSIFLSGIIFSTAYLPLSFAQGTMPMVRIIYFLPSDRETQPNIDEQLDRLIKEVQQTYADQMEVHGFGRKTFSFETDATGKAKVHHVLGDFATRYYRNRPNLLSDVKKEINERFDTSKNIYLAVIDISTSPADPGVPNCGVAMNEESTGGIALIPASGQCLSDGFDVWLTAHELGHSFGLLHDFRVDGTWIPTLYTDDPMITSLGAAEWLDVHRAFNLDRPALSKNEPSGIKMLPPRFVSDSNAILLRFELTGPDELHQAQLQKGTDVLGYKRLNAKSGTVEFVTTELTLEDKTVLLQVIDVNGNFTTQVFPIDVKRLLPAPKVISIPDPNLAAAVRQEIGDIITTHTILNLKYLDLRGIIRQGNNYGITNLTGLEHAHNLRTLALGNVSNNRGEYINPNTISDFSPLKGLTKLTYLDLSDTFLTDISALAGLTQLRGLYLSSNTLTDISALAGLTQLRTLALERANLSDISALASLTQLRKLRLSSNTLTDISALAGLTQLRFLNLGQNTLTDISALAGLTQLQVLLLNSNALTDLSILAGLTHLITLRLENNTIADVSPLVDLRKLRQLDLRWNPLSFPSINTHIPVIQTKGTEVKFTNRAHPALLKISGDQQVGVAGEVLPKPFVVEVMDARGKPVQGKSVTFVVTAGGGRIRPTTVRTNAKGAARATFTLGRDPGKHTVRVSVRDIRTPVTFTATATGPPIYWVDQNSGTLHRSKGNRVENFLPSVQNATSLGIDAVSKKLYWTEQIGNTTGRIRRAHLDGSNVQLVKELTSVPLDLAVDTRNRKLYLINSWRKIQRLNFDGSNFEPNFITGLETPKSITVDIAGGKLYWTEQTNKTTGRIRRAHLDGSNVQLVKELTNVPHDLAVDPVNGKLYLTNSWGKVQRLNLDGSNFEPNFITGLEAPKSITVDIAGGKLYWTERDRISCANLNGENPQSIITGLDTPTDIVLGVSKNMTPAAPTGIATRHQIGPPDETHLFTNYPNPFNPETWIPYQLSAPAGVSVSIYDVQGRLIRTLTLGHQPAGVYQSKERAAYWDGRNALGERVASGLYFYTLTAGDFTATRKMLIRK